MILFNKNNNRNHLTKDKIFKQKTIKKIFMIIRISLRQRCNFLFKITIICILIKTKVLHKTTYQN